MMIYFVYFVYHCQKLQNLRKLNLGHSDKFEIEIKKISCGSHFQDAELVISRCSVEEGKEMH